MTSPLRPMALTVGLVLLALVPLGGAATADPATDRQPHLLAGSST